MRRFVDRRRATEASFPGLAVFSCSKGDGRDSFESSVLLNSFIKFFFMSFPLTFLDRKKLCSLDVVTS